MVPFLEIVLIVGPIILGTYLSTIKKIKRKNKIIVWVICLVISLVGVYNVISERHKEEEAKYRNNYYQNLSEKHELFDRGFTQEYINGLGENPLLKHPFKEGQKYEKENRFGKAILEFKKCLNHPKATSANKTAAHILIGNCYYSLSKLKEAENHYKNALKNANEVEDKEERLRGRSAAFGNIGLIYKTKGDLDKALEYHQKALKIDQEIGYQQGQANQLGNIGLIYSDKGDLDKALEYHQKALKIDQEIGYQQGQASDLGNIGIVYYKRGKHDEALKYLNESLTIFKRIGSKQQIEIAERIIDTIQRKKQSKSQDKS
jgi:tetratricopeptide (TPR) repeat protein